MSRYSCAEMLMRSERSQRRATSGHASIFPSERQLIRYGRRAKGRSQAKNGRIRTRLDHHCLEVIYHRYLLFFYLFQRAIVLPSAPQATAGRSVKPLFHSSYNIFSLSPPFFLFSWPRTVRHRLFTSRSNLCLQLERTLASASVRDS